MKIVETKGLVKKYKDITAVDRVDLSINEGEIFGLLGPNGAGKSTIINLITTVSNANAGEILLFGKKLKSGSIEVKNKIGVVPQNLALYEDFTGYENLKFFGEIYGLKGKELKESIEYALEFAELDEFKNKKVSTYSGGMKRRLNIACAIIHKPKLVIMDEPTVGIDPQSRNHILDGVRKLNKEGTTIIYTTHYMDEVESLCSEIAIIDKGRLLARGSAEELKSLISDKTTLNIKIPSNFIVNENELMDIKGVEKVLVDEENSINITSIREVNNLDKIIKYFNDKEMKINDIGYKEINLESVFLTLTGRSLRD
ncbi:MAG: ABC transporter ATP-binding protein [Clostridium sp.]